MNSSGLFVKCKDEWNLVAGPFLKHEFEDLQQMLKEYKKVFSDDMFVIKEYLEYQQENSIL